MTPFDPDAGAEIIRLLEWGAGFNRAATITRVPQHVAEAWREIGRQLGHGELYDFARDVDRIEASRVTQAENALAAHIAGTINTDANSDTDADTDDTDRRTTRQQRREEAEQLRATIWFLERRCPDEYGHRAPLVRAQQETRTEFLDFMREHLDPDDFKAVYEALAQWPTPKSLQ